MLTVAVAIKDRSNGWTGTAEHGLEGNGGEHGRNKKVESHIYVLYSVRIIKRMAKARTTMGSTGEVPSAHE